MEHPGHHWKLGAFVVLAVCAGLTGLFWIGATRLHPSMVEVVSYFDESVQGLDEGAPVKIRGVTIGHVSEITIAPDHRHVEVHAELYEDALERLGLRAGASRGVGGTLAPPGVRMQVVSTGITGNKFLELDYFDPAQEPIRELPFPTPPNTIPAARSTLKSLEEGVFELLERLPPALEDLRSLLGTTRDAIQDLDVPGLAARLEGVLERLEDQLAVLDQAGLAPRIAGVLDRGDALLVELDGLAEDLRRTLAESEVPATAAAIRGAAARAEGTAEGLDVLARESARIPARLEADLEQLRETLESMDALLRLLERDPGSLLRGRVAGQEEGG